MIFNNFKDFFVLLTILSVSAVSAFAEEPAFTHDIQLPSPEEMGPTVRLADPGLPLSPPDNPEVGDSWIWYLFTWFPMPPHFIQDTCVVRGKSDRGYVVVKDEEWNVTINQSDVDAILEHWENSSIGPYPTLGIYEIDSLYFGEPPDELDNDPRIYLMWYDFHVAADGFFFFFDEEPDGTYPEYPSNECEVLYLNPTSSGGPSGDYMHAVIAHEFQHMIHWKYDDNESTWVNEGLSELAMWFYGNPDNISSFNSNPDNSLTVWDANWADYIQTYLWTLYFFERYGGHAAIYDLVHEPANSMAGYDNILDYYAYTENTDDIFIDWSVANFLDDTSLADGRYGYIGDDLPPFNVAATYSSYPVDAVKTVNSWATDYYRFQDISFDNLALTFDGSDNNIFRVRALVIHPGSTEVVPMIIDEPTQSGALEINGLTNPLDQVILVAASVSDSGTPLYQFTAGDALGISTDPSLLTTNINLIVTPNPFSNVVDIQLNWSSSTAESPTVDIYDLQGRIVQRLTVDVLSDGKASVQWNGNTQNGTNANAGIYYASARAGFAQCTAKLLLLP